MPHFSALRFTRTALLAAFALGLAATSLCAQMPGSTLADHLPSAPEPQFIAGADLLQQKDLKPAGDPPAPANAPEPAPEAPSVTVFPHPEDARYWISGQANIIFQGRIPFHSLYEGPNSFRNSAEYKTSMVGTLYTALRRNRSVRYNTDFIFDLEAAEGRGLSEALGLAGFTNLDVVRNPYLGKAPYIARYQIHQVIGLTDKTTAQESNFFALASSVPERRIEFRVGKMTLPDFFDVNSVGVGQPSAVHELDDG